MHLIVYKHFFKAANVLKIVILKKGKNWSGSVMEVMWLDEGRGWIISDKSNINTLTLKSLKYLINIYVMINRS